MSLCHYHQLAAIFTYSDSLSNTNVCAICDVLGHRTPRVILPVSKHTQCSFIHGKHVLYIECSTTGCCASFLITRGSHHTALMIFFDNLSIGLLWEYYILFSSQPVEISCLTEKVCKAPPATPIRMEHSFPPTLLEWNGLHFKKLELDVCLS